MKNSKTSGRFSIGVLICLILFHSSCPAPVLPGYDWSTDCRLVFSEIKLDYRLPIYEKEQFIELTIVCKSEGTHNRGQSVHRFYVVFFDGVTEEILMKCHLDGLTKVRGLKGNPEHYFVIGSERVDSAQMQFSACESAFADKDSLPLARTNPIGIALLKIDTVLRQTTKYIDLEKDDTGGYKPRKVFPYDVSSIVNRVKDFYVYGTTSSPMECQFFNSFYSVTQQHTTLRSVQIRDPELTFSLNRCFKNSEAHHDKFFLAPPSPGEMNHCDEAFDFNIKDQITKISLLEPSLISTLPQNAPLRDTSTPSRCVYTDFNPSALSQLNDDSIKIVFSDLKTSLHGNPNKIPIQPPTEPEQRPVPADPIQPAVSSSRDRPLAGSRKRPASSSTRDQDGASADPPKRPASSSSNLPPGTIASALISHGIGSSVPHPSRPFAGRRNIWENCNPFNQEWKADIMRLYSHAISIDEIMQQKICWWLGYSPHPLDQTKSLFYCKICNEIYNDRTSFVRERPSSKWWTGAATKSKSFLQLVLGKGETKNLLNANSDNLKKHLENPIHKIAEQIARAKDEGLKGPKLQEFIEEEGGAFRRFYKATEILFSAVYTAVKMGLSFSGFKTFTDFLERTTAEIGFRYHNSDGMKTIVKFIADKMKTDLFNYLRTSKPKVSVVLDSSVDISGEHNLVVLFFYVDESFNLRTRLYKYIPLTGSSADEIFSAFSKNIEDDGLKEWLMESMVGYTSDGASVMKDKLKDLIVDWLKIDFQGDERSNLTCWCSAHRLELTMKHAMKLFEYMKHIDVILNELYKFFNNVNLKNREALKDMIIELEDTFFTLKKVYEIRWIASKQRGTATILKHFATIAKTLLRISLDDENYLLPTMNQAQFLYDQIRDPLFLSHLAWLADLVDSYTVASKAFQRKDATIIDQKHVIDTLNDDISDIEEAHGPHLTELLSETYCDDEPGCILEDFEREGARLKYYGVPLERLPSKPGKIPQKPLSITRKEYVAQIQNELLNYFQPTTEQNFEVFHPSQLEFFSSSTKTVEIIMPDRTVISKPGTEFAKEALLKLNRWFVWSPRRQGVETILPEYLALVKSIMGKPDFQQMKTKTAYEFWNHYYVNQDGIKWTEKMKEAVRTGLAVSSVSSSAERYFSLYNHIKTVQRFNLKPSVVEALVRIAHEQDVDIYSFNALRYAIAWSGIHTRSDDSGNVPGTKAVQPPGQTCSRRRVPVESLKEAELPIDEDAWITSPYDKVIGYEKAIYGDLHDVC